MMMPLDKVKGLVNSMAMCPMFRKMTKEHSPAMAKAIANSSDANPELRHLLGERFDGLTAEAYDIAMAASKQRPTDLICINQSEITKIFKGVYDFENLDQVEFSSDIVFANTLPLKNFKVRVKFPDNDQSYDTMTYTFQTYDVCPMMKLPVSKTNISSLDDVATSLTDLANNDYSGMVVTTVEFDKINEYYTTIGGDDFNAITADIALMTIEVQYHSDIAKDPMIVKIPLAISSKAIRYRNDIIEWSTGGRNLMNYYMRSGDFMSDMGYIPMPEPVSTELCRYIYTGIMLYHGISVLLLNPIVKEIFENHSSTEPMTSAKSSGKNKRSKIRYIKKHVIRASDIEQAYEKRGFVRKAMIWYVTGHWREYSKTGKRVFIQGYWKGALRNMKDTAFKDLEPRERELVTKEETENGIY